MVQQVQEILEKLSHIQSDLAFIRGHLVDIDLVLTDDDLTALQEAESDLNAGKAKRIV